jgi:hypothetical protein
MNALHARVVLVLIGLLAIDTVPGAGRAAPLGTAFTYQGQLQQNGIPANGSCDMKFTLFDGDTVGAGQIGSTQPAAAVNVTNGLFTVPLDFGGGVFTGADRYLEIQVRCGSGSYVTLSPRQKLTAAPYALYAPTAGNLSGMVTVADGNIVLPESTATIGNILKSNDGTNVPFIHDYGTNNTFVGESAGNFTMTGGWNTAFGHGALASNTSGGYNTGLGDQALASNTKGTDNTAVGNHSLVANTAGNSNTAVGAYALYSNTATLNTAVGTNALYSNTTGYNNTAVGGIALVSNVTGGDNTAVGYFTLVSNTTGYDNTAVGSYALGYDTEICTGAGTPYACCTGAATGNCEGRHNTAVGAWTLSSNTTGSENTALGSGALMSNVTGYYNTAVGSFALGYDIEYCTGPGTPDPCCTGNGTGNCEGNDNTAVGAETLFSNTTGNQNTAVGAWTLHSNATGVENTALGSGALMSNVTGYYNTAVGSSALGYDIEYCTGPGTPDPCCTGHRTGNCEGQDNTAVGAETLLANTTGVDNTAVGAWTLWANTTGVNNTALGSGALSSNTTGGSNTAVGQNAMNSNAQCTGAGTPVSCCTGAGAGNCTTIGNRNIAIGLDAGSNFTGFETSNIDLGSAGAQGDYSTIRIGSDFSCVHSPVPPYLCIFGTQKGQSRTFIAGISGVTSSSGIPVYVNSSGQLGTLTSSARFKEDIEDIGGASDGLLQLRPVRFRYKSEIDPSGLEQYGLVAEEVAKVYPDLVTHDHQGRPESVRYHFVNAMLLNEVQKQARQLRAQAEQVEAHKAQIAEQTRRIEEQARQIETLTEHNHQLAEQALEIQALSARVAQLEATQQHAAAIKVSGKAPAGL